MRGSSSVLPISRLVSHVSEDYLVRSLVANATGKGVVRLQDYWEVPKVRIGYIPAPFSGPA